MSPRAAVVVGLGLAGCQTAAEPRAAAVAVRVAYADGTRATVELTRTATGCGGTDVVAIAGDVASTIGPQRVGSQRVGSQTGAWRLAPGPAGRELTRDGALVARIVDEPGRRSYVDPIGVPLGRVSIGADGGAMSGPAREHVGSISRSPDPGGARSPDPDGARSPDPDGTRGPGPDGLRWLGPDGRLRATITGTTDVDLALALVAPPDLPQPARALVACARLASTTPSPAKSP